MKGVPDGAPFLFISCATFILIYDFRLLSLHKISQYKMSQRIKPTGKQKQIFMVHAVIFAIATVAMWMLYDKGATGWVYPWPAWITAAWGLSLIGHWCAVYTSVEDKNMDDYIRQSQNG